MAAVEGASVREAYVCEALLRYANPSATWEDKSIRTTLQSFRARYTPDPGSDEARDFARTLRLLARDLDRLPAAAFPVKQVLIGRDQILAYLCGVRESAAHAEAAHDPQTAQHPFRVHPRYGGQSLMAVTGLLGTGLAVVSAGALAAQGHPTLAVGGAFAAAACTNGMLIPALRALYLDILNADLLAQYAYARSRPYGPTTAQDLDHAFARFERAVLHALAAHEFAWMRSRVRLPLSTSDRPTRAGSPRAPTAHEIGQAVRRSGNFRYPYDARVLDVDQYFFFDDRDEPALMTLVRER